MLASLMASSSLIGTNSVGLLLRRVTQNVYQEKEVTAYE